MTGYARITRREFYAWGGFSQSDLIRVQRGSAWSYWRRCDWRRVDPYPREFRPQR